MVLRVGIVTFHCSYNYGSALQAYALKRFLEQNRYEARVIHFVSPDFRAYKLLRLRRGFVNALRDIAYFPPHVRRAMAFRRFWKRFDLTEKYTLDSDMSGLNAQFDAFICGSDQIWNLDCTNGIVEPFFLSFAEKPKIAYAPSLAHRKFEVDYDKKRLRELLERFDALSVREGASVAFLRKYTGKKIVEATDPVLLIDPKEYTKCMRRFPIGGDYILLYELEGRDPRLVEWAGRVASGKRCRVVYFRERPLFGKNGVNAYGCAPEQWLWLLKNAACVVSNSFHATIFSVLFERPFVVFPTRRSHERMNGFLRGLGLEARVYRPGTECEVPPFALDEQGRKALEGRISDSKRFLLEALADTGARA